MFNYNAPSTAAGSNFAGEATGTLVTVTLDAYYTWAGNAAPNLDSDNDGANNLAEFAFYGDLTNPAKRGLTCSKASGGGAQLHLRGAGHRSARL